jgi:hypothetical protein
VLKVDEVMADLQERVRARLRHDLVQHGASPALEDAGIYAEVERVLREATSRTAVRSLVLPELLGDPSTWRLEPAIAYRSHRGRRVGALLGGIKQRLLMPVLRWLYEYSHDNFVRQQRLNHLLFACVQELAIQNAELRRGLERPGRSQESSGCRGRG